jgi:hypothetical protein
MCDKAKPVTSKLCSNDCITVYNEYSTPNKWARRAGYIE